MGWLEGTPKDRSCIQSVTNHAPAAQARQHAYTHPSFSACPISDATTDIAHTKDREQDAYHISLVAVLRYVLRSATNPAARWDVVSASTRVLLAVQWRLAWWEEAPRRKTCIPSAPKQAAAAQARHRTHRTHIHTHTSPTSCQVTMLTQTQHSKRQGMRTKHVSPRKHTVVRTSSKPIPTRGRTWTWQLVPALLPVQRRLAWWEEAPRRKTCIPSAPEKAAGAQALHHAHRTHTHTAGTEHDAGHLVGAGGQGPRSDGRRVG